jgi:flagellar biosynthesis/type III secretory pathway protein FliH
MAALELEGSLELAPDATLSRGGCVLTSNLGEVDAQIETRLELALTLLRSGALA